MRTSDVIAKDLHDLTYWLQNQEHQQAMHPHAVNVEGLERRLCEIKKAYDEMVDAVMRMKEVQHATT